MKHDDDRLNLPRHLALCTGNALEALTLRELGSLTLSDDMDGPVRVLIATDRGVVDLGYKLERHHDHAYTLTGSFTGWSDLSLELRIEGGAMAGSTPPWVDWTAVLKGLSADVPLSAQMPPSPARVAIVEFRAILIERLLPDELAVADGR